MRKRGGSVLEILFLVYVVLPSGCMKHDDDLKSGGGRARGAGVV